MICRRRPIGKNPGCKATRRGWRAAFCQLRGRPYETLSRRRAVGGERCYNSGSRGLQHRLPDHHLQLW